MRFTTPEIAALNAEIFKQRYMNTGRPAQPQESTTTPDLEPVKEKHQMPTQEIIDDVGNFINMDSASKYPSKNAQIEGCEPYRASILIATRLGNFFLLENGENGKAGYRPMSHAEVQSFCLGNGYNPDSVVSIEVNGELAMKSLSTGEL